AAARRDREEQVQGHRPLRQAAGRPHPAPGPRRPGVVPEGRDQEALGAVSLSVRIGLLGAGGISATHLRAAQSIAGVEVVAVHGANRDKTRALAAAAGATPYDDLDGFLAHPMDIVAIGSPSGLHADQAILAVRRGIHVLVEKPVDTTLEKIDALVEEADRARV